MAGSTAARKAPTKTSSAHSDATKPSTPIAAAAPKPAPRSHIKPKKLPPFPQGPEPDKPESYRKKIEAWRDLLEQQRIAWGGGTYPEYRRALARYQRGVDRYLKAIGRPRDPSEVPTYPAPKPAPRPGSQAGTKAD